jgi:hypothetical protein
MEHLTERLTTQFLFDRATRNEARIVVRHLLTQCPRCATLVRRILVRPPRSGAGSSHPLPFSSGERPREHHPPSQSVYLGTSRGNRAVAPVFFKSRATDSSALSIAGIWNHSPFSLPAGRPALFFLIPFPLRCRS